MRMKVELKWRNKNEKSDVKLGGPALARAKSYFFVEEIVRVKREIVSSYMLCVKKQKKTTPAGSPISFYSYVKCNSTHEAILGY